jgi:hypothetical protein
LNALSGKVTIADRPLNLGAGTSKDEPVLPWRPFSSLVVATAAMAVLLIDDLAEALSAQCISYSCRVNNDIFCCDVALGEPK